MNYEADFRHCKFYIPREGIAGNCKYSRIAREKGGNACGICCIEKFNDNENKEEGESDSYMNGSCVIHSCKDEINCNFTPIPWGSVNKEDD